MRLWPTLPGTPHTAAGQHGLQPAGPRVILVSIGEVPARSWGGGGGSAMVSAQRLLFCLCGDIPAVAGFCRRCYGHLARSRRRFAGSRETVLDRDGRQCQACGGREWLAVHHRQPGCHDLKRLITVCAACHARLHRLGPCAAGSRKPSPRCGPSSTRVLGSNGTENRYKRPGSAQRPL
jgi:hypothetical protein